MIAVRRRHSCGYTLARAGVLPFDDHEIDAPHAMHVIDNACVDVCPGARPT